MKIGLWRIFNVFHTSYWFFIVFFVVAELVFSLLLKENFLTDTFWIPFTVICVVRLFFYPKSFSVQRNSIVYRQWRAVSAGGLFWRVRGVPVKVTYTIWLVKEIEFCQNPIEKLFGVGHIRVYGRTEVGAKRLADYVKIPEPHVLYGIPHFDAVREQIEACVSKKEL